MDNLLDEQWAARKLSNKQYSAVYSMLNKYKKLHEELVGVEILLKTTKSEDMQWKRYTLIHKADRLSRRIYGTIFKISAQEANSK